MADALSALNEHALQAIFEWLPDDDLKRMACTSTAHRSTVADFRRRREWMRACLLFDEAMRWIDANPGLLAMVGGGPLWHKLGRPMHWRPGDFDLFATCTRSDFTQHAWGTELVVTPPAGTATVRESDNHVVPISMAGLDYGDDRPDEWRIMNVQCGNNGTLQFILSSMHPTWEAVVDSVDLTCCMVAIDGRTPDGQPRIREGRAYTWPAITAMLDPARTAVRYDDRPPPVSEALARLRETCRLRTELRIKKYRERGATSVAIAPPTAATHAFAMAYAPVIEQLLRPGTWPLPRVKAILEDRLSGRWGMTQLVSLAVPRSSSRADQDPAELGAPG
jgi:hypothetical protein